MRQRNIVYSNAFRNVCLNITYANTLHNVRQRNIVTSSIMKKLVATEGIHDNKKRPIVCLIQSREHPDLYWAVPVGKVNHRDSKAMERIESYMNKPNRDLRSCYYHLGRTTSKSIFFISDAIPITDKYILSEHLASNDTPYIIKNPILLESLNYKLNRILNFEATNHNYFRQHITDIKESLIKELEIGNIMTD